ncbi:hypothetical protein MUN81_10540 [Hymenobacter sp. 5317J-9]|uniref:hypothetical protein n=1 Tax=Hymenobacter sp. 5317J-9 TaxID=2932250 RepID=UPI001FD6722F|nr:hypothetical protein [Hymenobacter sp. 5317J-9]UOQ99917.1 hypothetical protein MUN81_10540 [Hymenobacter sp. 5317J-9]
MSHSSPPYRTLLGFLASLYYTDFRTVAQADIVQLLQEAGVTYTTEGVMLDEHPYTTAVLQIVFELVQETGHRNEVCMTVLPGGSLVDLRLSTSL